MFNLGEEVNLRHQLWKQKKAYKKLKKSNQINNELINSYRSTIVMVGYDPSPENLEFLRSIADNIRETTDLYDDAPKAPPRTKPIPPKSRMISESGKVRCKS